MKIISNFTDYYDSAINGYDTDESLIYRRFYEEVGETALKCPIYGAILFCGKVYPIIAQLQRHDCVGKPIVVDRENLASFMTMSSRKYSDYSASAVWSKDPRRVAETDRFWTDLQDRAENLHVTHESPILAVIPVSHPGELYPLDGKGKWPTHDQLWTRRGHVLVKNPRLTDLGFASLVEPWSARQEIEMYLGSVLCQRTMPPIALSNEERLEKHGFDRKISFRHRKD